MCSLIFLLVVSLIYESKTFSAVLKEAQSVAFQVSVRVCLKFSSFHVAYPLLLGSRAVVRNNFCERLRRFSSLHSAVCSPLKMAKSA